MLITSCARAAGLEVPTRDGDKLVEDCGRRRHGDNFGERLDTKHLGLTQNTLVSRYSNREDKLIKNTNGVYHPMYVKPGVSS